MSIKFKNINDRQDYISIDKKTAISAEGEIFKVGNKVTHDGADFNEVAIINKFSINKKSYDIIAHTNLGTARISFLSNYK